MNKPYPTMKKSARARVWLNPRAGAAHIEWSVSLPRLAGVKRPSGQQYVCGGWSELRISDCNRHITLECEPTKAGIAKVTKLIHSLLVFRSALGQAQTKTKEIKAVIKANKFAAKAAKAVKGRT